MDAETYDAVSVSTLEPQSGAPSIIKNNRSNKRIQMSQNIRDKQNLFALLKSQTSAEGSGDIDKKERMMGSLRSFTSTKEVAH